MFEVEIRGNLSEEQYEALKKFLQENGEFKSKQHREMYMLYDYPGFDIDPIKRGVDVRLRNTDGFCEIMLKVKASEGNRARTEVSLPLKDTTLDKAKEIVKALGYKKGLKMLRDTEKFMYNGVEWSLVNCLPKNLKYYEAEKEARNEQEIEFIQQELESEAKKLNVPVLGHDQMKNYIYWLDKEVNEEILL